MRALAERADVALMTLYNRFGNKDDLILLSLEELLGELNERADASGKQGIEFIVHSASLTADQILATPRYAQAMALMLFNGQIGSPIVNALLAGNVTQNHARVHQMVDLGELTNEVDTSLLARSLSTCTWSTILLWMKGLIEDAAFKQEYQRAPLLVLASSMSSKTRSKYRTALR